MVRDTINVYLAEIGRYSLLTKEEEQELGHSVQLMLSAERKRAEMAKELGGSVSNEQLYKVLDLESEERLARLLARGQRAREKMTRCNLRLVVSISKKYGNKGLPMLDLFQEGSIGLMRAVDKFDPEKGFRFSTYATWWIRQALTRAVADTSRTIRVPVRIHEKLTKIKKAQRSLRVELGRAPTKEEVSQKTGLAVDQMDFLARVTLTPASLDIKVGGGLASDQALGDYIPDTDAPTPMTMAERAEISELVQGAMRTALRPHEAEVLMERLGSDKTLAEIGKDRGVSRERIRQIETAAKTKLKRQLKAVDLQRG